MCAVKKILIKTALLLTSSKNRKKVIDLQEQLERYCNVLPPFGINSSKYDNILFTSYLLQYLSVNEILSP